jgi:lysophospholipase L1-like esterase
MPAHATGAGRAARIAGYATAGLVIAATLLLIAGPRRARALVEAGPSSAGLASPPAAPASPAAESEPASPSPSPSHSGPYRVVGLGDSVPAGSACDCTSYVSLVGRHQAARLGTTAKVSNLAEGGLTTPDLLDQLEKSPVRAEVAAADLVVVTVGANDFDTGAVASDSCRGPGLHCFRSTLEEQRSRLDDVFRKVEGLLGREDATVLVTGYWNVFLDGEVAARRGTRYVRNSIALTRAENDQIAGAARRSGATYVDIFTPFKGESGTRDDTSLLADDGDHPDAAGHRRIAEALESALA